MLNENLILLLQICAFCVLFLYNMHLFTFLRSILKNSSKNNLYIVAFSLVNITACFSYQHFITNYFLLFFGVVFFFFVECLILSPRNYRQALFAASVVTLHIAIVYLPIPVLLSRFFDVTPFDMVRVLEYRYLITIVIFLVLHILLILIKYLIKAENFILVSTAKVYSEVFIFVILFMCAYIAIDCELLITDTSYDGQLLLTYITSLFTAIAFYSILIYTIDIITFAKHKRQSDLAQVDYNKVLIKKNEIARKNITDDLTDLYNRKFIYKTLNELCVLGTQSFAILYLDVNGLKYVNDTYGHEEGDKFLKSISTAIRKGIREDDFPARIGGDEFIVLVNNIMKSDVELVVRRIENNLAYFDELEEYPVSASIGYLFVEEEMCKKGYKQLLEIVDDIMRKEKQDFYKKQNERAFLKRSEV